MRLTASITAAAALAAGALAAAPALDAEYNLGLAAYETTWVAAAAGPATLAAFVWTTFENEPAPATAVVLRDDDEPFRVDGVWSAAADPKWRRFAVGEQLTVVDATVSPPFSRAATVSRELGVDAATLGECLYYDGFRGDGHVTRPVIYDLTNGKRNPLAFVGGDFLDWAGDDTLVVGREAGKSKTPGASALALYGVSAKKKKDATLLADAGEAVAKLGARISEDVRYSPYLPAAWRLVPGFAGEGGEGPASFDAPGGGALVNLGPVFAWRPAAGDTVTIGEGRIIAASADRRWLLLVRSGGAAAGTFYAVRLAWE